MNLKRAVRLLLIPLLLMPGLMLAAEGRGDRGEMLVSDDPDQKGLVVVQVIEDSPAEKAGMKRGDILLQIDGKEVNSVMDIRDILGDFKGGDTVSLTYQRGDDEATVNLTLDDRLYREPLGLALGSSRGGRQGFMGPGRGMPFHELPDDFDPELLGGGAIIMDVQEDSPAAKAGLAAGDVILSVDGKDLGEEVSLQEILEGYSSGDTVSLEVLKSFQETDSVSVQLGANDDGGSFLGIRYHVMPFSFRFRTPGDTEGEGRFDFYGPRGRFNFRFKEYDSDDSDSGNQRTDL